MANKFYAVKKGRQPGIYSTWSEAQKQISGFSNAEFKSFKTKKEAEAFIKDVTKKNSEETEDSIIAYVDGSFDKKSKRYSYGVVLIKNDKVVKELSNASNDAEYAKSFQIAGECFGALNAMKWAIKQGYKKVIIYYDYLGIEMWARGKWKTNKKVSQDYVHYFKKLSTHIEVTFIKVKAHTGVLYNEQADQLAKDALWK